MTRSKHATDSFFSHPRIVPNPQKGIFVCPPQRDSGDNEYDDHVSQSLYPESQSTDEKMIPSDNTFLDHLRNWSGGSRSRWLLFRRHSRLGTHRDDAQRVSFTRKASGSNRRLRNRSLFAAFVILAWLYCIPSFFAAEFGISRRNLPFASSSRPVPSSAPSVPDVPPSSPPVYPSQADSKVASQIIVPPSQSETVAAQAPLPNVVRLIVFEQSGQSFGSGAYIGNYGEYGLILSNWHVVCESDGLVHVHFSNGFSSYGSIMTADKKWDLALIAVSRPPQSVPMLSVARTLPKPGEQLWIAGYGAGVYRLASGRCVRYLAPEIPKDGSAPLYEIIELSVSARQGDSGGPILNSHGELAGVLFGSDMVRNTAGSGCERVNRFLSQAHSFLGVLPPRPEDYFFQVEQGKPKRTLHESRNVSAGQSTVEIPKRRSADIAGSATTFGVRAGSRRYIQSPQQTPSQPPVSAMPSPVETPWTLPSSTIESGDRSQTAPSQQPLGFDRRQPSKHGIQTAEWTDSPRSGRNVRRENSPKIPETNIVQTGHHLMVDNVRSAPFSENLIALKQKTPPGTSQSETSALHDLPRQKKETKNGLQGLATVSERNATLNPIISIGGSLLALTLISLAVQLLKNDGNPKM